MAELLTKNIKTDIPVFKLENTGTDYVLRCIQGIYKGYFTYLVLTEQGEWIGSSEPECTLCIKDCGFLPRHIQIKYGINDLTKKHGYNMLCLGPTWIKIRYEAAPLNDGMEIKIGKLHYVLKASPDEFNEITEWLNMHDLSDFKQIFGAQIQTLKQVKSHKVDQYLPILNQFNASAEQIARFKEAYEEISNILLQPKYDNYRINLIDLQTQSVILNFGWAGATISSRTQTYQKPPDILIQKSQIDDFEENTDFELVFKFQYGKYWVGSPGSDNFPIYFKVRDEIVQLLPDDQIKVGNIVLLVQRFNMGAYTDIGQRRSLEDGLTIVQELQVSQRIPVSCYAIFDGHNGSQCMIYVSSKLLENIRYFFRCQKEDFDQVQGFYEYMYQNLRLAFKETDNNFYQEICDQNTSVKSGCVCAIVLIAGDHVISAYCGDCRAILSADGKAISLTEDHKASNQAERERIYRKGGQIDGGRVGQLAITRAFGDFMYKAQGSWKKNIITAKPDLKYHVLDYRKDEFIVLCSDGVIDGFQNNQNVVDFVRQIYSKQPIGKQDPQIAARQVVLHAVNQSNQFKKGSDNTTCIVINLSRGIYVNN